MKYRIYRTSQLSCTDYTKKPCKQAKKGEPNRWGDIQWYIDIETLDDLQALMDEVGKSVILHRDKGIEIYDDYRE